MAKLVILPAGGADLIDIGDFIALDNPPRAVSFVVEIEAKITEIGERPGSFQERDDLHPGLRHAPHGRYRRYVDDLVGTLTSEAVAGPAADELHRLVASVIVSWDEGRKLHLLGNISSSSCETTLCCRFD